MAVVHPAELTPTKSEIAAAWLDAQPWGGSGEVEHLGGYRFDDPDGEVGVEGVIFSRGDLVAHLPMTYRGAPLEGAEDHLLTTMEHGVLGPRWVYHAIGDPVALDCFARALLGGQEQATVEAHLADGTVEPRPLTVTVRQEGPVEVFGALQFTGDLADPVSGTTTLVARWDGGEGVVAAV